MGTSQCIWIFRYISGGPRNHSHTQNTFCNYAAGAPLTVGADAFATDGSGEVVGVTCRRRPEAVLYARTKRASRAGGPKLHWTPVGEGSVCSSSCMADLLMPLGASRGPRLGI